jgi:hypothetical protein
MSWFSPRGTASGKDQGRSPSTVEPDLHRSLAFAALCEELRRRKMQVLDLGSAVGSNVEFLAQFGCKLFIEDLYTALSTRGPGEGDLAGPGFFAEFLSIPPETRFDVILAWDLFDYLQRKELAAFSEQLRSFTNRGALIFSLISYHKTIPAQPYRFRIQDEQHLIYERRTTAERPSPRLAPAEVTNLLKGFRVDRSFLLKHGISEYLLVRE